MFMIQGTAVGITYFRKWIKQGTIKMVFMSVFMIYIFGFMGISFIGMLDSIMDFRRVRYYKSTQEDINEE